jgi:hypothetical protein
MIDLYVYYKVRSEDAPRLAPRVRAMQARLAANGIGAQLKRRPDAPGAMSESSDLQTWMEVYPSADDGLGPLVEQAALDAGIAEFIQGPRRSEVFVDLSEGLAPCA